MMRFIPRRLSVWAFGCVLSVLTGNLAAQDKAVRPVRVGEKRALLIGNAEYQHTTELTNTIADVNALEIVLRDLDFEVKPERNLKRMEMATAIVDFEQKLKSGDLAFFYFSGHGVRVGGINYLLPVEYKRIAPNMVSQSAISADWVRTTLNASGADVRVLVIDACRNNPFGDTKSTGQGFADQKAKAEGTLIAYAAAPGQTADDNPGGELGLYMTHLLPELRRPSVNLSRAFKNAQNVVYRASKEKQLPAISDLVLGEVYLRGEPGDKDDDDTGPSPTPKELWDEIKGTSSKEALKLYIEKYKEDSNAQFYVALARTELKKLQGGNLVGAQRQEWVRMLNLVDAARRDWSRVRGMRRRVSPEVLVQELEAYVEKYGAVAGAGEWVRYARAGVEDIKREQEDIKREQLVRQAKTDWEAVRDTDDVEQLGRFVREYGTVSGVTDLVGKARNQLEDLSRPNDWTNGIGMTFVWVPAGEFLMGSESDLANDDERPLTQVKISKPFWMGKYEVTQGQWKEVMGTNPSEFKHCGPDCPVENVSWEDVQKFIRKLNGMDGGATYRLPTEAEWEYAARARSQTDTPAGNLVLGEYERYVAECRKDAIVSLLNGIAWFPCNSEVDYKSKDKVDKSFARYLGLPKRRIGPHPVGRKTANEWGLHDMLGNVWEWVADWHGTYPGGSLTDPLGPVTGKYRVARGSSWSTGNLHVFRSSARTDYYPSTEYADLGFRLLRTE